MMRALTVRQPWAWAILYVGKNIENRTWSTTHRGPLLIHAGKTFDHEGGRALQQRGYDMLINMPGGAIVGMVDVVDVQWNSRSRWAEPGCFHWVLANPRVIQPIECRGAQGLWTFDDTDVRIETLT